MCLYSSLLPYLVRLQSTRICLALLCTLNSLLSHLLSPPSLQAAGASSCLQLEKAPVGEWGSLLRPHPHFLHQEQQCCSCTAPLDQLRCCRLVSRWMGWSAAPRLCLFLRVCPRRLGGFGGGGVRALQKETIQRGTWVLHEVGFSPAP